MITKKSHFTRQVQVLILPIREPLEIRVAPCKAGFGSHRAGFGSRRAGFGFQTHLFSWILDSLNEAIIKALNIELEELTERYVLTCYKDRCLVPIIVWR